MQSAFARLRKVNSWDSCDCSVSAHAWNCLQKAAVFREAVCESPRAAWVPFLGWFFSSPIWLHLLPPQPLSLTLSKLHLLHPPLSLPWWYCPQVYNVSLLRFHTRDCESCRILQTTWKTTNHQIKIT